MKKGTKLYSILKGKCPHCHIGAFFTSSAYKLKTMGDVYEKCPVCNESFNPEPGFYFGALYVSYALGCAFLIGVLVAIQVLGINISLFNKCAGISIVWLLLTPKMYGLSKIIWANFFMHYKTTKK